MTSHALESPLLAERSSLLHAVATWSIFLYVATSPFYLALNITAGDLWMLLALPLVLVSDRATERVLDLVGGSYGMVAGSLTVALLFTALNAGDVVGAASFVLQMTYIVWVVVPIIAAGIAEHPAPYGFLVRIGAAYLAFFAVGLVLLFGVGNDAILYQSGIGRVFQRFTTYSLQLSSMALGVAALVFGSSRRLAYLGLLLGSAFPILLNASRTGMVTFASIGLLAAFGTVRSVRGLLTVAVSAVLLIGAGYALVNSTLAQELWQIRVLSVSAFLEDDIRLRSMAASLAAIRESPMTLFFGAGWGSSGAELVVHNLLIQVLHEGGLLVLVPMLAFLCLPLAWVASIKDDDPIRRPFVVMLMAGFLIFWSLNALVVERPYWLALAIALGLAHRPRSRAHVGSPQRTPGRLHV